MNKLGALLLITFTLQALPLSAQGVAPNRHAVSQDDVTGAIDKGALAGAAVAAPDASGVTPDSAPGHATISYEQAFREWRNCAVKHLSVGNPPPQCDALREGLRQAIGARQRDFSTTEARPRS